MREFESRVGFEKDLGLSRGGYFQKLEDIGEINAELARLKGRETKGGIVLQELSFFRMPKFDFGSPSELNEVWQQVKQELMQRAYPPHTREEKTVSMLSPNFGRERAINEYMSELMSIYPRFNWKTMGGYFFGMTANWQTSFPELPYNWMIVETFFPTDRLNKDLNKRKNLSYLEISDQIRSSKEEIFQMLGFSERETLNISIGIPTLQELTYLQLISPEMVQGSYEWTSTQIEERNIFTKISENNIIWNDKIDSGDPSTSCEQQRNSRAGYRILIKPNTGQVKSS